MIQLSNARMFYNEATKRVLVSPDDDHKINSDGNTWPCWIDIANMKGSKNDRILQAITEVLYLAKCGHIDLQEGILELSKIQEVDRCIEYQLP